MSFADKTVLITGAAKGIGKAVAMHFARDGARVALVDRDRDALETTIEEVIRLRAAAAADCAVALAVDVAQSSAVSAAVATAIDRLGGLDVVINNAGIHFARGISEYTDEEWNRVQSVNVNGVDTPLLRSWANTLPDPEAVLRGQAEMHLLNRLATAEEVAAAITFLASPAASFITGVILPVEGGATLGYRRC